MPNFNLTDTQKIMVGIAYSDVQKLGEKLADAIKSGELIISNNQTMEILIDKFINYDFAASHKLLARIVSPDSFVAVNFLCAGGDIIGGSFLLVGKNCQKIGNYVEGKKSLNPFRPRKFFRRPISKGGMGYRGMRFITSAPASLDIPFETIQKIFSKN